MRTKTIFRKRYVIMRNNRSEILVGRARNYYFKSVHEIEQTAIKTYRSEKQARAAYNNMCFDTDVEIVEVIESYDFPNWGV